MFKWLGKQIIRPYSEVVKTAKHSCGNIVSNVDEAKSVAKSMATEMREGISQLRENGIQAPQDPQGLFKKLYAENDWTQDALAVQRKHVVKNQIAYMLLALVAAMIGVWQINLVGKDAFLMPAACTMFAMMSGALFIARAGLMAWWRCQLDNKSIMSFFEFVGRDDFYKNMINPFRFSGSRS